MKHKTEKFVVLHRENHFAKLKKSMDIADKLLKENYKYEPVVYMSCPYCKATKTDCAHDLAIIKCNTCKTIFCPMCSCWPHDAKRYDADGMYGLLVNYCDRICPECESVDVSRIQIVPNTWGRLPVPGERAERASDSTVSRNVKKNNDI
ncbi:MAG: hypothetical protein SD837_19645 [Candidatus Electrothrix scaldis]|nr:MAG: hypothetical protein SD837_19645 [Candidatus Electrothrix sp. GW3-3]